MLPSSSSSSPPSIPDASGSSTRCSTTNPEEVTSTAAHQSASSSSGSHPAGAASASASQMMMMNSIPALMYSWEIVKGESKFHYVSDYCQELLGVSSEAVLQDASHIINLILEEDVPAFSRATIHSRSNLSVFDCQVRMRRATDGTVINVHFKGRPRRQGLATIWDGVAMQVPATAAASPQPTERRSSYSSSDTMMVDESIRLPIPQYYQHQHQDDDSTSKHAAVKQLVHAERSLTEWLSHEVRNPLSVTMEALQTLQELTDAGGPDHDDAATSTVPQEHEAEQEDKDGYSVSECYQVMTESITYVVDLLNNMMDLDQCAQGQMPVVTAPCTVKDDILLPTYRMMKRLRPKDGPVQLRLAPGANAFDENVMAHVDKLRLRQVLTNLIANSFHFTTQGFVEVDLQIQEEPTKFLEGWGSCSSFSSHALPPRMLSFHVRDSGCGVKPCEYDTLFSRWDQLGTSRNGTGIGLCLCQALVMAMGGSIRLNTQYDSGIKGHPGAEFIVEVPMESLPYSPLSDNEQWVKPQVHMMTRTTAVNPSPAPQKRTIAETALSSPLFATNPHTRTGGSLIDQSQPLLKPPPSLPMSMSTPIASVPLATSYRSRSLGNSPERRGSTNSSVPPAIPLDSISSRSSSSSFATAAALATAMTAASATTSKRSTQSSPPRKNAYFRGRYRFLIVDDEKMGRKFLKRRFSRLFPEATVTEVASGEEALVKASSHQYDVITMDHFMAVDEMNGDETIRELRSRLKSDALIMGISGNDKQAEHVQAGADSFFQKPLPNDSTLVESLQQQLAPPAGWKVLILSDDASVASTLTERMYRVASPHFTTQEEAKRRWKMMTRSLGSATETIELLMAESFDLVVLVDPQQTKDDDASGANIQKHLSQMASSGEVILVNCLRSDNKSKSFRADSDKNEGSKAIGLTWSLNALPSIQGMRQSLCEMLVSVRGVPDKTNNPLVASPVSPTQLPPRRTNSGVAKSA